MTVTDNSLAQVHAFLANHTTLTLATIGPDGEPQAADLYYAETRDLTLYFVSTPGSRHAVNIAHDSRVAATIHAQLMAAGDGQGQDNGWRNIRGVQLEGRCLRVPGVARPMAWARYTAKYPFVLTDATLARALLKVDMYRISPHWLRWIDSSLGLGNNPEWVIVDDEWHMVESVSPLNHDV